MKKRGVSTYVSWILILAFAIGMGALVFTWISGQAKSAGQDLTRRADEALCNSVAVSVDSACQNSQSLYMNISNTYSIKIDTLQFLVVDIYGNTETKEKNIDLYPGESESGFWILKQGTTGSVKISPIISQDKEEIICLQSALTIENIKQC